jgi:hypothetical protein
MKDKVGGRMQKALTSIAAWDSLDDEKPSYETLTSKDVYDLATASRESITGMTEVINRLTSGIYNRFEGNAEDDEGQTARAHS